MVGIQEIVFPQNKLLYCIFVLIFKMKSNTTEMLF